MLVCVVVVNDDDCKGKTSAAKPLWSYIPSLLACLLDRSTPKLEQCLIRRCCSSRLSEEQ